MKFLFKKIFIILFLLITLLVETKVFAKDSKIQYTRENISNYFLGIVSANNNFNNEALRYLKKVESLKNRHSKFNVEFVRMLVLLEKFDEAFIFSKSVWDENELFFEADLLLGLDSFKKKDYKNSEKYFERLNKISRYNVFFDELIGNVLISWSQASQGNRKESFKVLEKIPKPYRHFIKTQNSFLKCYFDSSDTEKSFEEIIQDKNYNFSRYNFFLANYYLIKK